MWAKLLRRRSRLRRRGGSLLGLPRGLERQGADRERTGSGQGADRERTRLSMEEIAMRMPRKKSTPCVSMRLSAWLTFSLPRLGSP